MHIRTFIFFFLLILFSGSSYSQTFVKLDWNNPSPIYVGDSLVHTNMPGFANAHHESDSNLPYYVEQIELGRDYASYNYNVKVEYPEFDDKLSGKEIDAIEKEGALLADYPQVDSYLSVSAKNGILVVRFVPLVYREGRYQRINSFKLTLEKEELPARSRTRATQDDRYVDSSVLASGKWVKIRVSETGVHQITNSELSKMGFSNPAKVRLFGYGGFILPEDVRKTKIDDLQEVPLWRESNHVLFYANGTIRWELSNGKFVHTQNHYSTHAHYFLTEGDETPMEFPIQSSLTDNDATETSVFHEHALVEKDAFSWREGGRKLYDDYDYRVGDTRTYNFKTPGITNDAGYVTVAFSAYSATATTTTVTVDGTQLGNVSISRYGTYDHGMDGVGEFSWSGNKSETTSVVLKHNRTSGVPGHLDYIRLNYTRHLALSGSSTAFRMNKDGKYKFRISNTNENTKIWNVGDPANYMLVDGTIQNGQYTFVGENSEYVAVNTKGSFSSVEIVGTVENQNLHSFNAIDMIIITPPNAAFITEAERLAAAHREKDGLSVEVVTSDQVYNEFSSGTPDATAYRWLMKMLYDRAKTAEEQPKYLLLFADGAYDNRMLSLGWKNHNPKDFLLCFVSENSVSEVNSYVLDDYYGLLDDGEGITVQRDKVDIGVGRFPIRTATQAKQMVDKSIAFMNNTYASVWKSNICFLGDDGTKSESESSSGGANIHMRQAEELAASVESSHPEYSVKRIFWDSYKMEKTSVGNRYPEVTKQLLENFNSGALMINYTGHGGPASLSHEYVFIPSDIPKITSSRPTLFVTAACEVAPFDGVEQSLGEQVFLHSPGGAIAVFSTTRTVYSSQNAEMNKVFVKHLFSKENGTCHRLGDIMRLTKAEMAGESSSINNLHFVFLGNPALRLVNPEYQVVVDEFNGVNTKDKEVTKIKAGSIVAVKGRILDSTGELANQFKGSIYPTVLDTKEKITTYNNNGYGAPYTFDRREKTLFTGSNPVKDGTFSFEFPVPLDINYSDESGLLNFYALDSLKVHEGQGYYANFLVGGTQDDLAENDSLGPKITLYLNTHDFVYGGKTNETPYLVATLEDKDGINTSGNGIGHDIVAIIDNSPNYTYVLNSYYESEPGNYQKGTVRYSFPELPEGKHQLLFRAWDVKNNSSTAILNFEVVKGLKPELFDIDCTRSPVNDKTEFIISHNRPESVMQLNIQVYDLSGKVLWTHNQNIMSESNYYSVEWNLTTNDGLRVAPGLYLFNASLSANGGKESTKAKKIVVLAQ